MEKFKAYLFRELKEPVPSSEKGIMPEPLERVNRLTKKKSKDIGIAATAATVFVPFAAPITLPIAAGAWAWKIGDEVQSEISQVAKREIQGKGKSGVIYQKVTTA